MRSRNIKPGFFKNDRLAELEPLARILFAGLWCMADRAGRLEYRPKKIKVELLPYDNCDIEILVKGLAKAEFVTIYKVEENSYIEINNFLKHQTPHIKEPGSIIPAPDKNQTSTSPAHLIPDSLNLIPDSMHIAKEMPEPVDNSNGLKKELQGLVLKISEEYTPRQSREVQLFLELNHKRNPDAICHCLRRLIEEKARGSPPASVGKWLEAVMREEDKNYNAEQSEQENNEMKTATIPQDIKGLLDGIGKGGRK